MILKIGGSILFEIRKIQESYCESSLSNLSRTFKNKSAEQKLFPTVYPELYESKNKANYFSIQDNIAVNDNLYDIPVQYGSNGEQISFVDLNR